MGLDNLENEADAETKVECPSNQVYYGQKDCLPCIQTCGSQLAWCTRYYLAHKLSVSCLF